MRTALVSPCFLDGNDAAGNSRLERNIRYINHYNKIKNIIGFDQIILFDNASSNENIALLEERTIGARRSKVTFFGYNERLFHGAGKHDYPYCWRALYEIRTLILCGYKKIIFIDSDGFVLSERLADHIRECDSGWVSYWSTTHSFPESSIFILNQDAFVDFCGYTNKPWQERVGKTMETDIPFTEINRDFNVGRFGEMGSPPQDETHDYYGQANLSTPLQFGLFA